MSARNASSSLIATKPKSKKRIEIRDGSRVQLRYLVHMPSTDCTMARLAMRCDMIDESCHPFLIHTTIVKILEYGYQRNKKNSGVASKGEL